MIKTPCPLCDKQMGEHNKSQIEKCLWTFVREARNPVAFAAINSRLPRSIQWVQARMLMDLNILKGGSGLSVS